MRFGDRRSHRAIVRAVTVTGLTGFFGPPIAMQKDEHGVWTSTSEPLAPEIYQYNFMVDGTRVTDPSNSMFMASYHRVELSYLLVPGDNAWTPVAGTPRGAVAQHLYHSAVTNDEREFYVYTPPGYDPKRRQPYPVVYLLHGLSEDAKSWIQQGATTTLDNLINQGKAVPMIMVAPLAYGMPNGPAGIDDPEMQRNFKRILTEEVMPVVYKQYNASTKPADNAIAGLSMGGAQTICLGLNELDKFAWFGAFSGALVNWAHTVRVGAETGDALGGKDAISKVKTMSIEGTMQVMGSDAPTTTITVDGVGTKQESEFNGSKIISCYTDKGGWTVNPMIGATAPTPMPDDQYNSGKAGIYVGGPLYDYAAKGSTIELVSADDKAYTIKLTTKEQVQYTFVIDAKTNLVNSITNEIQMQGQPVTVTTSYSDYRKTETGLMVPYVIGLDLGQFQLSTTVKKVEVNKTIDPAIFAMPKA